MSTPGERLRDLRRERGWSQRELGRQAGVSYPVIAGIENATAVRPAAESWSRLAEALGVTIDYLVRGAVEEDWGISDDDPELLEWLKFADVDDLKGGPAYAQAVRLFKRGLARQRRERQGGVAKTLEPAGRLEEEERAG